MADAPRPDLEAARQLLRDLTRVIVGWVLIAGGGALLVVGWLGVSREALVARQLPYFLSGGFGGLALVIVGAVLVASHDLSRFNDRLDRLESQLSDLHEVLLVEPSSLAVSGNGAPEGQVAVLPEGERFHRPACPVVQGKEGVDRVPRTEAEMRGLLACKLCHDEDADAPGAVDDAPAGAQP